jgi:hypothetical protein
VRLKSISSAGFLKLRQRQMIDRGAPMVTRGSRASSAISCHHAQILAEGGDVDLIAQRQIAHDEAELRFAVARA